MINIGCLQFAPHLGNLDATLDSLISIFSKIGSVDLLVLPELCNSGYNFLDKKQAWETSEKIEDSRFLKFLENLCKKGGFHIVSGFNERFENELFNSAVLIGPNGFIGKYQKLHLFNTEKNFFAPGNAGLPIFEVNNIKIGIQICFDWMFPEAWRVLALKGAEIICHPSNLVLPGLAQKAVPIHALTNRLFTITANRIGQERNLTFTGLSTIANPKGEIIAQASAEDEEILTVQIEPEISRNKWVTDQNNILLDRRPEQYSLLSNKG